MHSLLANETAEALRSFLNSVVPEISDGRWNRTVISFLTFETAQILYNEHIVQLVRED